MSKIIALFFSLLIALPLFAANEGRAIRSNWPCMDAIGNCVGQDQQSITFTVSLRFKQGAYTSQQPVIVKATVDGDMGTPTTQYASISSSKINNLATANSELVGFTPLGQPRYALVNDVNVKFTFQMAGTNTEFDFEFVMLDANYNTFPIEGYPNLMAMQNPPMGLPSYTIDHVDQITEIGNKKICTGHVCETNPGARLPQPALETDQLTTFPNPFNNQITLNYQTPTNNSSTVIELIDIQGKTIQQLIRTEETAGQQQITLETIDLSAGVYFARITNGEDVQTAKIVKQME